MIKQIEMYDGDMIAEYDETQEMKDTAFEKLIKWYQKYNMTCDDDWQSDDPQIEAQVILADILRNVVKFKTIWKD